MAKLHCSVLAKRETIPACGRWCLRNVQKHVELHDIYQSLSREIVHRSEFFSYNVVAIST